MYRLAEQVLRPITLCVNGKLFRYNFCSGPKTDPIQCKRSLRDGIPCQYRLDYRICTNFLAVGLAFPQGGHLNILYTGGVHP